MANFLNRSVVRSAQVAAMSVSLAGCQGDTGTSAGSATDMSTTLTTGSTGTPTTGAPTTTVTTDEPTPTEGSSTLGTDSGAPTTSGTTQEPGTTTTTTSGTTQGVETQGTTDADTSTSTTDETTSTSTGETTDTSTSGDTSGDTSGTTGMMPASDIEIVITADNAYGFAYGTDDTISMYWGGIENQTAGQIFNCGEGPELYVVPAAEADNASFLYIIAWADSSVTQGVLGRFRRKDGGGVFGEDVFTGTEGWEVCATGKNYSPGSGGPPVAEINEFIGKCNADALDPNTTSVGWVDEIGTQYGAVALGEDNTTPYEGGPKAGNEFPLVCQNVMPAEAHWMWFDWDPSMPNKTPFMWPGGGTNPDHQFLIFRFAADLVPIPM